ncbi:Nucleoside phosphatase GDA1/CD39 [Macleaya cordata]|uniref:Nucleoside phosphatase GDA1/CD39 n=1 Tax=Macleaya cordata TaxID=56857 RepID=A0A200RAY0_MACCD|nr:Nucleoside phosphatase GDA1/CD39 [Macleaya cordata]
MLLHSFPDQSTNNSLHKDACLYHCMQTEPGLDKFVHNFSGLRVALEPLLHWAEQQIPSERHRDTSIFLLATAGLRRLPSANAAWILENAEAIVKKHPFKHRKSWIRVLSGQEEAYYGWIALNYKMGTLNSSSKVPTLGVLDLGGSSLQVVMETDELREDQNSLQLKIGSVEHQILAYSLPKFGLNEAFERTVVMLSEEQSLTESTDGRFQLRHPCLSLGFLLNYTCYGCFQKNISNSNNKSGQLQSDQSTSFYLTGDPDWEQCKRIARAAATHSSNSDWLHLTAGMNCKERSSSFTSTNSSNLISSPRLVSGFHALSGFFAVYSMLDLNPRANLTNFWERGEKICSGSWINLKKFSGNRKYADQFCFRVPYLASLLEDALCMGDAEVNFGPGDVSWTLGAALAEGEHRWLSKTEIRADSFNLKNLEVLSYPTSLIVIFSCILLIVYRDQAKQTALLLVSMPSKKRASIGASLPSYICPKRQLN